MCPITHDTIYMIRPLQRAGKALKGLNLPLYCSLLVAGAYFASAGEFSSLMDSDLLTPPLALY